RSVPNSSTRSARTSVLLPRSATRSSSTHCPKPVPGKCYAKTCVPSRTVATNRSPPPSRTPPCSTRYGPRCAGSRRPGTPAEQRPGLQPEIRPQDRDDHPEPTVQAERGDTAEVGADVAPVGDARAIPHQDSAEQRARDHLAGHATFPHERTGSAGGNHRTEDDAEVHH